MLQNSGHHLLILRISHSEIRFHRCSQLLRQVCSSKYVRNAEHHQTHGTKKHFLWCNPNKNTSIDMKLKSYARLKNPVRSIYIP